MSSEWQRKLARTRAVKRKIIKDEGLTLAKLKQIRDELDAREKLQSEKQKPASPTTQ